MSPVLSHFLTHTYEATDLHRRVRTLHSILESVIYDEPEQMRVLPVKERIAKAIRDLPAADQEIFATMDEKLWSEFTAKTVSEKLQKLELKQKPYQ